MSDRHGYCDLCKNHDKERNEYPCNTCHWLGNGIMDHWDDKDMPEPKEMRFMSEGSDDATFWKNAINENTSYARMVDSRVSMLEGRIADMEKDISDLVIQTRIRIDEIDTELSELKRRGSTYAFH